MSLVSGVSLTSFMSLPRTNIQAKLNIMNNEQWPHHLNCFSRHECRHKSKYCITQLWTEITFCILIMDISIHTQNRNQTNTGQYKHSVLAPHQCLGVRKLRKLVCVTKELTTNSRECPVVAQCRQVQNQNHETCETTENAAKGLNFLNGKHTPDMTPILHTWTHYLPTIKTNTSSFLSFPHIQTN